MPVSRRHFFLGSFALSAFAQKRAAPARPNILLILADELGQWMLGCYGNKEIRTPHIDFLARTGTRFTNSYTASPADSASRATLFTGRTPMQHGGPETPAFQKEIFVSDVLAGAGYACGYVGAWRMGGEQPQHGYQYLQVLDAPGSPDKLTAAASAFLDRQQPGKPFFLAVSFPEPRAPYEGHAPKYYQAYAETAFEASGWLPPAANATPADRELLKDTVGNLRKCAAAVTALDDQVAALHSRLSASHLENTLIVFTSVSGLLAGRHGLWDGSLASNPPNMYEEVMRVPMIWSWLGRVAPDNTRPELISLYDLMPSLSEAAGADLPAGRNLCGRSYLNLAANKPLPKNAPWPTLLFGHSGQVEMARDGRYKVVVRQQGKGPGDLYDLRADPHERLNQYENPQFITTRERLIRELDAWRKKYSA